MEAPEGLDATIAGMKADLDARQNPSTYQPPAPGPVETRIQQLEDLVARLLNKISPGPMTPEAAEEIRASATPFNEKKEHPGDCDDVHPNKSHEAWEETS